MNYTENYQLSQWAMADRIQMQDFNADNAKIDAAIKAADQRADSLEQTLTSHATALSKLGSCQIYTASYVGAANGGPVTHTFPHKPYLILLLDLDGGGSALAWSNMLEEPQHRYLLFTWEGNTVTWHCGGNASTGMNYPNRHYQIIAFLDMAE